MDSEKHTEFLNYFLNKDKKYPERTYNVTSKKRDNQKVNFRRRETVQREKRHLVSRRMLKQLPDFLHSSLSASLLMLASTWTTVRVTTTTSF